MRPHRPKTSNNIMRHCVKAGTRVHLSWAVNDQRRASLETMTVPSGDWLAPANDEHCANAIFSKCLLCCQLLPLHSSQLCPLGRRARDPSLQFYTLPSSLLWSLVLLVHSSLFFVVVLIFFCGTFPLPCGPVLFLYLEMRQELESQIMYLTELGRTVWLWPHWLSG